MKTQQERADADLILFAARELEHVSREVQLVKYPAFKQRQLIPTDFSVNPGARSYTYYTLDMIGYAKVVGNYAKDFPRVTVRKSENVSTIKSLGDSYGYDLQDMRAASMSGMSLDMTLATAAKQGIQQTERDIAFFGSVEDNLPGFFTNTNIPSTSVAADGTASSTLFSSKTADQILRDMNDCVSTIVDQTNDVEQANTLLMAPTEYELIRKLRIPEINETVLSFFTRTNPEIEVVKCLQCKEPTSGWSSVGASFATGNIMVAYRRDPLVLQLIIPQDFEQFPPERENLEWSVNCHERIGGTIVRLPLACNISEGV